ncbi:MAG: 50S ribosomal protein L11 methyltransferase [Eubacteriales bacterium]
MKWNQLKVNCDTCDLETVSAVMSMLDESLMIDDYSDAMEGANEVYGELVDEKILTADKTRAAVSIFTEESVNLEGHIDFIRSHLSYLEGKIDIEIISSDEDDWRNAWRKYYKPTRIGERLVIVPDKEDYVEEKGDIRIDLEPGLAFGTGTHETTRLCASFLEKYVRKGDYMLDVGAGSGILAICASKLGVSFCAACDIDPIAVRTEKENAERNGCSNIDCFVSDLLSEVKIKDGKRYNIVTANIVADIIIKMSSDIGEFVDDGGIVITSGVIAEREDEVDVAMIAGGFVKLESSYNGGWCAGVFKKTCDLQQNKS